MNRLICGVLLGLLAIGGARPSAAQATRGIPAQELPPPKRSPAAAKPVTVEIKPERRLPTCYTPAQYRAEQAVRYQTQLMVAGMLCQSADPRSYSQYQAFTQRNSGTINRADNVLIGYFKDRKTPHAELNLHTLRTNMANDISIKAMQISLPVYCKQALVRLGEASGLQPRQFETYLTKLDLSQTSSRPVCTDAHAGPTLTTLKNALENNAKPGSQASPSHAQN